MKSCFNRHSHAGDRASKSVRISSPIVWRSNDQSKLFKKQQFVENMNLNLTQIKDILGEHGLSVDDDSTYENCVERLVHSQWVPSDDAIQIYQRQRAKPVRTAMQKQEDRVRLVTVQTVSKLSCAEMKLWLQRNGGRVPEGSSDADRKNMERTIRNQMRVITPFVKQKRAPKRPKKTKKDSHTQRTLNWEEDISQVSTPPPNQHRTSRPASHFPDPISPITETSTPTRQTPSADTPHETPSGREMTLLQPMSSSKKRRLRRKKRARQFFDYDQQTSSCSSWSTPAPLTPLIDIDRQKTVPKQQSNAQNNSGLLQRAFGEELSQLMSSPSSPTTPPSNKTQFKTQFMDTRSPPETPIHAQNLFITPTKGHETTRSQRLFKFGRNDLNDSISSPAPTFCKSDSGGGAFLATLYGLMDTDLMD